MFVPDFLPTRNSRGSILLIVLFAIVLLSSLVVAYLMIVSAERQISAGSAAQTRVDRLAQVALETVIGDLQGEIVAGSDKKGAGTNLFYIPRTNAAAIPYTNVNFTNTYRISKGGAAVWKNNGTETTYTADGPIRALSGNSSATNALNRKGMTTTQWNLPKLMGTSPPSTLAANMPDWVFITRKGATADSTAFTLAKAKDSTSSNDEYVLGRYAMMVYDVGGLANINAVGNLLSDADKNVQQRGRINQVSLANLPGFTASGATSFLQWRNATTAADATWLLSGTNLSTQAGGPNTQTFLRRQDLLNYSTKYPDQIPSAALPYLTVFSYSLNRPAYTPPTFSGLLSTAPSVTYPNDTNVGFQNILRADGAPLVTRRFPLNKIYLLESGSASDLLKYFGLTKNADGTFYYKATSIKTLTTVATENRDPDFFELLKGAILSGSLGQYVYQGSTTYPPVVTTEDEGSTRVDGRDKNSDLHILRIGANIIDQYDKNNYPTIIKLGVSASADNTVAGIENIPYLFTIWMHLYRPQKLDGVTSTDRATAGGWFHFQFWNPHQNAADSLDTTISGPGPTEFRVVATAGSNNIQFSTANPPTSSSTVTTTDASGSSMNYATAYGDVENTPYQVRFTNTSGAPFNCFKEPRSLTPVNATTPGSMQNFSGEATNGDGMIGILIGQVFAPDTSLSGPITGAKAYRYATYKGNATLEVQYRDANGTWQTYQRFPEIKYGYIRSYSTTTPTDYYFGTFTAWANGGLGSGGAITSLNRDDPRGSRFGFAELTSSGSTYNLINQTFQTSATGGVSFKAGRPTHTKYANFITQTTYNANSPAGENEWMLSENRSDIKPTPNIFYYFDLDGVIRRADGSASSHPIMSGTYSERPRVLNRPFRSVGELAYVFRDLPWKTLDFQNNTRDPLSTQSTIPLGVVSADSALLEVFSVDDTSNTTDNLVAGKVWLNGRNTEIFKAALQGATLSEYGTSTFSGNQAQSLSSALVAATKLSPVMNRADLVARIGSTLSGTLTGFTAKTDREAAIHTLGELGQADTWNLLVDLVVQSGKLSPNAAKNSDFTVDAEVRTWTHISIDRYTGRVVKMQSEVVDN